MEIIAHRGESHLAPENTLAAVKLAWELGNEAVEIDMHLSSDQRVMVCHDASTRRTAGVDLAISQTDSAELRKLDVGSWKGSDYAGEKIPFLEEVLETIPPDGRILIEIKCGTEILPHLERIINEKGKARQVIVVGFGLETMTSTKQAMPEIPVLWIRGPERDEANGTWLPYSHSLIDTAIQNGLDGLSLHYAPLERSIVDAAKERGLKLYVWTIDELDDARRMLEMGAEGLTTNRGAWMRKQLRQ